MTNVVLVDTHWSDFLPLTFTRPVSHLRTGILTIAEKWEKRLNVPISCHTEPYLSELYPCHLEEENLFIDSSLLPDSHIVHRILKLESGMTLVSEEGRWVASKMPGQFLSQMDRVGVGDTANTQVAPDVEFLQGLADLFMKNFSEIERDFNLLVEGRISEDITKDNTIYGDRIFVEEGVDIKGVIIDATKPVYIGQRATIMPGTTMKGPIAIGEGSIIKMGAKIYGGTTIGPYCKAGGDINNAIMMGYSNKSHDGYLGNSVIGEWCNLGADTNTSNLKNNYSEVKLWNYNTERFKPTGTLFCGLVMGDHSKCGINTMFNTGTVAGVSANIYGAGYQRNFIPSFSWGGPKGMRVNKLDKALDVAEIVMKRRHVELTDAMKRILEEVFRRTEKYRPQKM